MVLVCDRQVSEIPEMDSGYMWEFSNLRAALQVSRNMDYSIICVGTADSYWEKKVV